MSKSYYGSIDVTKINDLIISRNPAITVGANGKTYLNVTVWVNDTVDKFGNIAAFQSNFKGATKEDRHYFGNLKESQPKSEF